MKIFCQWRNKMKIFSKMKDGGEESSVTGYWSFEIGEFVGQVLTGVSIASEIAPINPTTGLPYFTIKPEGWGGGWSTGNVGNQFQG